MNSLQIQTKYLYCLLQIVVYKCIFNLYFIKHQRICLQMRVDKQEQNIKRKLYHDEVQSLKIQLITSKLNQFIDQDDFSNSSEANWQVKNFKQINHLKNKDENSVYSNFSRQSKKSLLDNLCKVVDILRKKMPNKSLEQIIIRVYQAAQLKKQYSCLGSIYGEQLSQCSELSNFESIQGSNHQFLIKREADLQSNLEDEKPKSIKKPNIIITQEEGYQAEDEQKNTEIKYKQIKRNQQFFLKNLNNETNYIYKPIGTQVVVEYLQKDTFKTKFINVEEQNKYKDQRFVAQSFLNRGYGVCECRKEMQLQNIKTFMHRDTYKALSTSMMIFAFRKLESFISIECGKKIKFIDRHQMQSIYITLLNCRINMQPEYVITLMKYIKACYGLGDVVIGQIESVQLYLTCQKYLYGKNVTMQFLQKIGEIKLRKEIKQTLVYINNRSKRYQQRLITLRRTRKEKKMKFFSYINNMSNTKELLSMQVKREGGESEISLNEDLKLQEIQFDLQQELDIVKDFEQQQIKYNQVSSCITQKYIQSQQTNSIANSAQLEQISNQKRLNQYSGYNSLSNSEDQDCNKGMKEEIIFDFQLQNLSAELYNEQNNLGNHSTINKYHSYKSNLRNQEEMNQKSQAGLNKS